MVKFQSATSNKKTKTNEGRKEAVLKCYLALQKIVWPEMHLYFCSDKEIDIEQNCIVINKYNY